MLADYVALNVLDHIISTNNDEYVTLRLTHAMNSIIEVAVNENKNRHVNDSERR